MGKNNAAYKQSFRIGATILLLLFIFIAHIHASPEEIKKILELPEKDIDVGRAALILSKDAFPDIDIEYCLKFFDNMAMGVNAVVKASIDKVSIEDKRIGSMNTFLYRAGPWNRAGKDRNMVFTYDEKSVEDMEPKALFIPNMLLTHKGTCATMPVLWYILADRLKWDVNIVRLPGHLFVRYNGAKLANIEATANGGFIPDSQYIKDMRVPNKAIAQGVYMKSLSKKQFISTLMVNNAFYLIEEEKDSIRAIKYLKLAVQYDNTNAEAFNGFGTLTKNNKHLQQAKELGITDHKYSDEFYKKRKNVVAKTGGNK
ncbi:MAG: hypothetical protein JXA91_04085 [Candidatus Thermoplasmatota archaeon]|nr:hypothetical protein [Candidatus Thermoplasmatota archaeon]